MAAIVVIVGEVPYRVDLSNPATLLGFVAAMQCLALAQQGIESDPAELIGLITPSTPVTVVIDDSPDPEPEPDGDDGDLLAAMAELVERGVMSEAEFEAKRAALAST